jgi:anti-anti-sigma factor
MEIQVDRMGTATVVKLAGKLDALSAPDCEQSLRQLVESGSGCLVLDFADLGYISSAGLRVVLAVAKLLQARQGQLLLANLRGNVGDVFEVSGFANIFPVHPSREAAVAACAGSQPG